jgi:hypothetical protein
MADVLELTHIAREAEPLKPRQRRIGNAFGLNPQLLRALLQEMPSQHGNVFAPLAQCWQTQTDDVEAVKQVLAKHAVLDALLQSWCVAAITRTLVLTALCPPTR